MPEPDLTSDLDAAEVIVMGDAEAVDTDTLPPTQYLVMEVLAARYRLCENAWTFPSKLRPALEALSGLGLLWWKHATIPGYCLTGLTGAGRKAALSASYAAPAVTVTEWGCRYDEEFIQRVHDEAMARKIARAGRSLGHVPVSRKMTIGPWEEVPGEH